MVKEAQNTGFVMMPCGKINEVKNEETGFPVRAVFV